MAVAKAMTKAQIMAALADQTGLSKKDVVGVVEALTSMAYSEAKKGFTVPGLGKLVLQKRKARIGRNPATGESIKIPAKTVLKFRIAKAAKDAVAGAPAKKAAPKKKAAKKVAKKAVKKAAPKKAAKKAAKKVVKKAAKKATKKKVAKKAVKKTAKRGRK